MRSYKSGAPENDERIELHRFPFPNSFNLSCKRPRSSRRTAVYAKNNLAAFKNSGLFFDYFQQRTSHARFLPSRPAPSRKGIGKTFPLHLRHLPLASAQVAPVSGEYRLQKRHGSLHSRLYRIYEGAPQSRKHHQPFPIHFTDVHQHGDKGKIDADKSDERHGHPKT